VLSRASLIALALALCSCATARAAKGEAPEQPVIQDIEIEGARQIEPSVLKEKILSTQAGWWPFAEKHRFDPIAWQADLRRIQRYYQAQGYYQAQIADDRIVPAGSGAVKLVVRVEEGEPTRTGKIEIRGLEELPPALQKSATKDLPLRPGAVFLEDAWGGVKGEIQRRLRDLGYAEATVKGEAKVDLATHLADVEIEVTPGLRYRFGNIFVAAGARPQVKPAWIIEQVKDEIRPNVKVFSERALADAQASVFKMGVFSAVKVNRGAPDRQTETVPVVVDVREAPFHTISLGGGGGVDLVRNDVRLVGEYTDRNFLGDLRRLTTRVKGGYAFLPNVVTAFSPSGKKGFILDALAELEQPRLFGRPDLRGQTSVSLTRGIEPAYSYFGGQAKLGVLWQAHRYVSLYPSFNLEGYRLNGTAALGGTSPQLVTGCATTLCTIYVAYLEQTIEWDRRQTAIEPKKGYYFALSLQEAGGPSFEGLQSFGYVRFLPEGRGYVSFGGNDELTLAARMKLGTLLPFPQTPTSPIISRFFSGGGNDFRGFNSRQFSPMQLTSITSNGSAQQVPVPIGGNGLVEATLELRYNLNADFVLAAFLDAGLVTTDKLRFEPGYYADNLLYAVGIGLRYQTLIGPIRADVGFRLPIGRPLDGWSSGMLSDAGCFFHSYEKGVPYAGAPENRCAFHLSIGEAF
jgi:translocation and assembly module TamA